MNRLKNILIIGAGFVLIAVICTAITSRRVSAQGATDVRVVNTISTQDTFQLSSKIVELVCEAGVQGNFVPCKRLLPDGQVQMDGYKVPAGVSLVITSV